MGCMASSPNVKVPWTLSSLTRYEWLEWKKCFLTFMEYKYIPPYKQIRKFFKYMGFLGEEISNDFLYFHESKNESNLKTLLFKFDVYFMFTGITRMTSQSIEEYILLLKYVAEQASNHSNIEKVIKEKILQDFKVNKIFDQIKNKMPMPNTFNYETLALNELIFLWNECEKPIDMQQDLLYLQNRKDETECLSTTSCLNCGKHHELMKCYAAGQKCYNCGELNHYARCCSNTLITNCLNCGYQHPQNKCPAFGKKCFKCKEMNHFSSKCCREMIKNCIYCGKSHTKSQQNCTANDKRCSNCNQIGHFANMCYRHTNVNNGR